MSATSSSEGRKRFIWPALHILLCGDLITYSDSTFAGRCGPHLQALASRVDKAETALVNGGRVMRRRFDEVIQSLLQETTEVKIYNRPGSNQKHFDSLTYFLLGYRLLQVLERPLSLHLAPRPAVIFPRLLKHKPISRIYSKDVFDWPVLMRTSYDDVLKIEKGEEWLKLVNGEDGGTLMDRLETLDGLKATQKGLCVLQNIQTAVIHLIFLLDGSTSMLKNKSRVPISNLPLTLNEFIAETERIQGKPLDAQKRAKIKMLVKGSAPNLKIQLLTAALISPIFLFQPFQMEKKTWRKKTLLQTAYLLGNQKPDELVEVEGHIWDMLEKLQRSGAPLMQEVLAMFQRLPWEKFEGSAVSDDVRHWFACEVKDSTKKGLIEEGEDGEDGEESNEGGDDEEDGQDEDEGDQEENGGGRWQDEQDNPPPGSSLTASAHAYSPSMTSSTSSNFPSLMGTPSKRTPPKPPSAKALSSKVSSSKRTPRASKHSSKRRSSTASKSSQASKSTTSNATASVVSPSNDYLFPDVPPPSQTSQPRSAPQNTISYIATISRASPSHVPESATIAPQVTNRSNAAQKQPRLNSSPHPLLSHDALSQVDGDAGGRKRPREDCDTQGEPKRSRHPGTPLSAVDSSAVVGFTRQTITAIDVSYTSDASILNDTTRFSGSAEQPICIDIDVEEFFSHRSHTPARSVEFPSWLNVATTSQVFESNQQISSYTIEGHGLDFYVPFVNQADLDMLLESARRVSAFWVDDVPHVADSYSQGNSSIFCDWIERFTKGSWTYTQDTQRWRVLLFRSQRVPEVVVRFSDFETMIRGAVVRYSGINAVVMHDQSAAEKPDDPRRIVIGLVDRVIQEARLPLKKRRAIYSIPPIASFRLDAFDSLYCSETIAYEATHHRTKEFRFSASPAQTLSYRTVLSEGGIDYWQMAPSGLGVAITVEFGEVYAIVADPGDSAMFGTGILVSPICTGSLPVRTKVESVYLLAENRIVIPPCTFYLLFATKHTVCHKRYFYSPVHMQLTHIGLTHSFVLGDAIAREPATLEVALPVLCRTMVFWHDLYMPENRDGRTFTPNFSGTEEDLCWHIPTLVDFNSVIDLFSLINTIILLPVYDSRMYPNGGRTSNTSGSELSFGDWTLYRLALQHALKVGNWFFSEYQLLSADHRRYLGGKDEFWAISLLHHANMVIRYHSLAERRQPSTTRHTTGQVQKQLLSCLQPFSEEIHQWISVNGSHTEDCAVFLEAEKLKEITDLDDPSRPLPLLLFRTTRDFKPGDLPSVQKRD